MFMIIACWKVW